MRRMARRRRRIVSVDPSLSLSTAVGDEKRMGLSGACKIDGANQQSQGDKPKMNDTLTLTDREVLDYARESLERHLPLQAEGVTAHDFFES